MKPTLILILLLSSCGSGTQTAPSPEITPNQTAVDASTPTTDTPDLLSTQQCEVLFEHVFEVAFTAQQETLPEGERPTPEDLEKAKLALREGLLKKCVGGSRDELHYDCAIKAMDRPAMEKCMQMGVK